MVSTAGSVEDPRPLTADESGWSSAAQYLAVRSLIQEITVEDGVLNYIAEISDASRRSADLTLGASTRAAIHILLSAKTFAAIRGHKFVTPDDVKTMAMPVLRHRLLLKPEAEIEGLDADAVIKRILAQVEVPR